MKGKSKVEEQHTEGDLVLTRAWLSVKDPTCIQEGEKLWVRVQVRSSKQLKGVNYINSELKGNFE